MKSFHRSLSGQARTLISVSKNSRLPFAKTISVEKKFIWEAYKSYVKEGGNPWEIGGWFSSSDFKDAMKSAYNSKSKDLSFISEMRRENAGKCCSMCGSLRSCQVDHYLPKEFYPEFAIFLPNLFPVCGCNQRKGAITVGAALGERLLHPGFDKGLSERSIFVRIRDHGTTPTYQVIFRRPRKVANDVAFEYHCKTLISKDDLEHYVRGKFEEFVRRPSSVSRQFKRASPASKEELRNIILDELEEACIYHKSKNNWDSIFLHALLERRTLEWIWRMASLPGRSVNSPLI